MHPFPQHRKCFLIPALKHLTSGASSLPITGLINVAEAWSGAEAKIVSMTTGGAPQRAPRQLTVAQPEGVGEGPNRRLQDLSSVERSVVGLSIALWLAGHFQPGERIAPVHPNKGEWDKPFQKYVEARLVLFDEPALQQERLEF